MHKLKMICDLKIENEIRISPLREKVGSVSSDYQERDNHQTKVETES